jgi:predicted O-methyltransferase YrrM
MTNTGPVTDFLLRLHGADPFDAVREASERHREEHECDVYPSDHLKMRFVANLVLAMGARRILEVGGGLGYSALWLASAAPQDGIVETIDRFQEHAALGERYAAELGYSGRVQYLIGEAAELLPELAGPYDLVHDDGWFARKPAYYDRMVELLRPGGLLVMSNWFLLDQALRGETTMDWAEFAGPTWAGDVQDYARTLIADERLRVSFIMAPAYAGLACRVGDSP